MEKRTESARPVDSKRSGVYDAFSSTTQSSRRRHNPAAALYESTQRMHVVELSHALQHESQRLGFDLLHIAPAGEAPHADFFDAWIEAGRAGEMEYLTRNRDKRRFPMHLADGESAPFQSIIVLGVNYHQFDLPPHLRDDPSRGLIAAYAWGDDYHEIIRPLLYELDAFLRARSGRRTPGKCLVDTGPILERDWAAVAGLGFTGKNCCTIRPTLGSWLLLAVILAPELLVNPAQLCAAEPVLTPARQDGKAWTCARCTRCLDACPTAAFTGPYDLDPRRCIAYWTIETRAIIPRELRPHFGNRIFGCDICQEVCPYNRRLRARSPQLDGLRARHERIAPRLLEGFAPDHPYWLEQDAFSVHFKRSPVKRARRAGMLRNVCVALGNWGDPAAVAALTCALNDAAPVVRVHAAWALGRILAQQRHEAAAAALATTLAHDEDERVRSEARWALTEAG